jgi:hypothetical protein
MSWCFTGPETHGEQEAIVALSGERTGEEQPEGPKPVRSLHRGETLLIPPAKQD